MSTIHLSRTKLNFCSLTSGAASTPQEVSITNSGSGTLKWNISVDAPWLICAPGSGAGNGTIFVSINSAGLTLGTYTGKVIISDPNATNSPQSIFVTLKVKSGAQYTGPFGEFSTPVDGSTVRNSIPVTGWALDDIEIQSVKIYREDGNALVLIGDVVFVEGARPDVEAAYPDYPFNYKAGWGYMLLTNFLPNGGNGVFKLHAVAASTEGKIADLGVKTITVDNAHAVKPFGAIDTPTQGGTASGKHFINSGWILTPMPNMIPFDGSTIGVWIDGVYIGHPVYNKYREDIALLFPGYANSNGAACYYYLDTTAYKNAIHTIQWTAADSGGNIDGIGSRYFSIQNSAIPGAGGANDQAPGIRYQGSEFRRGEPVCSPNPVQCLPVKNLFGTVDIVKGYREDAATTPQTVYPNENGIIAVEIKELERVEIHFPVSPVNNISSLPIGSTLDVEKGIFYWQPGPGFIGEYHLVFIEKEERGPVNRKDVIVKIIPGY
ncbi:MAG: Ig-like domain-containing protein [Candidatus Aminicenantes bacterium]|nr:Ig-like domain-containing protein [Candidatus Aminicenantes bacterium]